MQSELEIAIHWSRTAIVWGDHAVRVWDYYFATRPENNQLCQSWSNVIKYHLFCVHTRRWNSVNHVLNYKIERRHIWRLIIEEFCRILKRCLCTFVYKDQTCSSHLSAFYTFTMLTAQDTMFWMILVLAKSGSEVTCSTSIACGSWTMICKKSSTPCSQLRMFGLKTLNQNHEPTRNRQLLNTWIKWYLIGNENWRLIQNIKEVPIYSNSKVKWFYNKIPPISVTCLMFNDFNLTTFHNIKMWTGDSSSQTIELVIKLVFVGWLNECWVGP